MLSLVLAGFTFALGVKGFTRTGLPVTGSRKLTGTPAKVVGTLCILLALFLVYDGILALRMQLGTS